MKRISKEILVKLYKDEGESMKKIANELKTSPQTIMRRINKFNIPLNSYETWNKNKKNKNDKRILAGKEHPNYKLGDSYPPEFYEMREKILPNAYCSKCNKKADLLHHIDKDKFNNKEENLMPSCFSCHTTMHNKERGQSVYKFTCKNCGEEVVVISNNIERIFCSLHCKSKYYYKKGISPIAKINKEINTQN